MSRSQEGKLEADVAPAAHPLDNVIWSALTTRQAHLAERCGLAARFRPDITTLAAIAEPSEQAFDDLSRLLRPGETTGIMLDTFTDAPQGWSLVRIVPCLQMVQEEAQEPNTVMDWRELHDADAKDMLELTELTRPGPFAHRTCEMGVYLGIHRNGQLVSMAGERMRVPGHTEVSAVCTHPDHLGHGYASALMGAIIRVIRSRGEKTFLHVRDDNERAIEIYHRLGFRDRVRVLFVILRKNGSP